MVKVNTTINLVSNNGSSLVFRPHNGNVVAIEIDARTPTGEVMGTYLISLDDLSDLQEALDEMRDKLA